MTRTRNGSLEITSTTDVDSRLIVKDLQFAVQFLAVDRATDQRVRITLEGEQLDKLAAEILRIREDHAF